jgi:hypothetical protein
MAITKTLIEAIPYEDASNQVEYWNLTMKYKQGTEGNADYYESSFNTTVYATEPVLASSDEGVSTFTTTTNFTELDKTAWSLAELTALCPTTQWDSIFDSQYDSVITNPSTIYTSDDSFVIPS